MRWTPAEDRRLMDMVAANVRRRDMAAAMGCTYQAIRNQIRKLRKGHVSTAPAIPVGDKAGAYIDARHRGLSPLDAATETGSTSSTARNYEQMFRTEITGQGMDATVPRFARHEAYVALVLAQGDFTASINVKSQRVDPSVFERRTDGRAA